MGDVERGAAAAPSRERDAVVRVLRGEPLGSWRRPGPQGQPSRATHSRRHDHRAEHRSLWGIDMTATVTLEHGQVAVFIAVDHCSAECTRASTPFCTARATRRWSRSDTGRGRALRGASQRTRPRASASARTMAANTCPTIPERDRLARSYLLTSLRQGSRGQRLRGALHPYLHLGQDLPDRRRAPPCSPRVQVNLQEHWLIDRYGHRSPAQFRRD